VVIGSTVTIKCNVHGIPPPAIQWLVNNHPLDTFNRRYKLLEDGHQLEITNTEVSDTGRYTCIAKNEAGIVDRDFDLEVLGMLF
jgi:hemicentin